MGVCTHTALGFCSPHCVYSTARVAPESGAALPDPQAADWNRDWEFSWECWAGSCVAHNMAKAFVVRLWQLPANAGALAALTWWGPQITPHGALGACPADLELHCLGFPGSLVPGPHLHRPQTVAAAGSPQQPVGSFGSEHSSRAHGSQLWAAWCQPETEASARWAGPFP